jgi:hypothetical protein
MGVLHRMRLNDTGAARPVINLVAVLWKSDTEGHAVLARRVTDRLSESVSEVRLVGVALSTRLDVAQGLVPDLQPSGHLMESPVETTGARRSRNRGIGRSQPGALRST